LLIVCFVMTETALWAQDAFSALCHVVTSCENFKVRIKSAAALAVPAQRSCYGDTKRFICVWSSLSSALENSEDAVDFLEYRYSTSLRHTLSEALLHLLSLSKLQDMPELSASLAGEEGRGIKEHLIKYLKAEEGEEKTGGEDEAREERNSGEESNHPQQRVCGLQQTFVRLKGLEAEEEGGEEKEVVVRHAAAAAMDAFELFKKLGAGAKFDFKRFGQDAARFKVPRSQGGEASLDSLSAIDYFGTGAANGAQSWTQGENEDERGEKDEESRESGESEAGGKRKQKEQERDVGHKAKKTKSSQMEEKDAGHTAHDACELNCFVIGQEEPRARFSIERIFNGPVSLLGSGVVGLRSYWIWKDSGLFSSTARPPAAAGQFGLQSSDHLPDQRTGQPDILVSTPNRLIYLLDQDPPGINLNSVEWLVVDESDKLFEDGKTGFREQLATIFLACSNAKGFLPPMLVFVQSIERARELFHELVYEGINVDVIHAERTQQQVETHTSPTCVV
ncbi:hypothetical protein XENOCAPTIV_019166, partial [Xenoophorus captivus]